MAKNKADQAARLLSGIHAADVARYTLLPGIVPRVRHIIADGAGSIAGLMALVFAAVRLLPPNHPYLRPENKGRFGIRHVFGEAWTRLVFKRENIDQIIIFFALIAGFALLVLQFVFLLAGVLIHSAHAAPTPFSGMFTTANPNQDIALMLLDSVFGVPGMYDSCVSTNSPACGTGAPTYTAYPTPFQTALQALFQYYSLAMLLIAVLVVLYYILIVVGETAQTGTPFGRRFDHIWAPIRLIVAIGLLVPLNYGYNSGQYIVLITARMASGFATNAWLDFNTAVNEPFGYSPITPTEPATDGDPTIPSSTGDNLSLIARPRMPDVSPLVSFMTLVESCKVAYETLDQGSTTDLNQINSPVKIKPYMVRDQTASELTSGFAYDDALTFYSNGPIQIVFGDFNTAKYATQPGHVMPFCGSLTVSTKDIDLQGVKDISSAYFGWVLDMYFNDEYLNFGVLEGCLWLEPTPDSYNSATGQCDTQSVYFGYDNLADANDPPDSWKQTQVETENDTMVTQLNTAYNDMVDGASNSMTDDIKARGWGGAGIWYNVLSTMNGAWLGAVKEIPSITRMPSVMEKVSSARAGHDQSVAPEKQYDLNQGDKDPIDWKPREYEQQIAMELDNVYKYWEVPKSTTPAKEQSQHNVIIDILHILFGVDGLYDITQNDYANPLVSLVAIGHSILTGALRNLLIANGLGAVGGGIGAAFSGEQAQGLASALEGASSFFMMLVTVAVGIGVTLYYVLPFMPFLYFYFAVGQWVKSIFEAMVGVPLWALAHLKINGQGLPTESGIAGYFLIFEIFLRPILTVFGLLASVSIFSALVRTLNNIFPLVTANLTGFDCAHCDDNTVPAALADFKRDTLDQFFFTILYTIVVYMIGTSSFKLIDQVPDGVLRWMNNGVQSFAQMGREDVGRNLGEHAAEASTIATQYIAPAMQNISTGIGAGIGQIGRGLVGGSDTKIAGATTAPSGGAGGAAARASGPAADAAAQTQYQSGVDAASKQLGGGDQGKGLLNSLLGGNKGGGDGTS